MHTPGQANVGLVPQSKVAVSLTANKTGTGKEPLDASRATNNATPVSKVPNLASLPLIREQLEHSDLPSDATNIILDGKILGNTYVSRWLTYCQQKHLHVSQAIVYHSLEFLTSLFRQGLGYSAINTARSALSAIITLGEKTTFGEHPLVTRFMKGIFCTLTLSSLVYGHLGRRHCTPFSTGFPPSQRTNITTTH